MKKESIWVNDFSCPIFFLHSASSSYAVLIACLCETSFVLNKQKEDKIKEF